MLGGLTRGWRGFRRWAQRCIRWMGRPWGPARTSPYWPTQAQQDMEGLRQRLQQIPWNDQGARR